MKRKKMTKMEMLRALERLYREYGESDEARFSREWPAAVRRLKESGADLSKIRLAPLP